MWYIYGTLKDNLYLLFSRYNLFFIKLYDMGKKLKTREIWVLKLKPEVTENWNKINKKEQITHKIL